MILPMLLAVGCGSESTVTDTDSFNASETSTPFDSGQSSQCGHELDPATVSYGFNQVLNEAGAAQAPQGKPLQEGWTLAKTANEITDHNSREYARVAAWMMPIRDALMCDIATLEKTEWLALTEVLTINGIKTSQDLSGTPMEQTYSSDGIYDHLKESGPDTHPMLKYLEEAELELKCLAFEGFDFTNPEGDDHCQIHGLKAGTLKVP